MRLLWCIQIDEKHSSVCGLKLLNRYLAIFFTLAQLTVAYVSFYQHIFSIYKHRHVFLCKSNIDYTTADFQTRFLAYDIIIFDFGLMRRVLGTDECVANYLDGGYMRFAWCFQHASALSLALMALIFCQRPIWLFWPALMMQSSYSLGMSVLTMATAPKILEAFGGRVSMHLASIFGIFISGFIMNWIFTFILWHYYWHIESKEKIRRSAEKELKKELVGDPHGDAFLSEEIDDDEASIRPSFV